jgi:hypothetical protein
MYPFFFLSSRLGQTLVLIRLQHPGLEPMQRLNVQADVAFRIRCVADRRPSHIIPSSDNTASSIAVAMTCSRTEDGARRQRNADPASSPAPAQQTVDTFRPVWISARNCIGSSSGYSFARWEGTADGPPRFRRRKVGTEESSLGAGPSSMQTSTVLAAPGASPTAYPRQVNLS